MAFEYLAYVLSQDEEIISPSSVDRRLLREVDNPFDLTATEFRNLYRLTPDLVEDIVSQLDSQLRGRRITAITTEKQVNNVIFKYFSILNAFVNFKGSNCLAILRNWLLSTSRRRAMGDIHEPVVRKSLYASRNGCHKPHHVFGKG